jgi:hypothetical protein
VGRQLPGDEHDDGKLVGVHAAATLDADADAVDSGAAQEI